MWGNPNIENEGKEHRFSSTKQPKNRGRKPSKLKKFIKDYDVSDQDIKIILNNLLFNYTYAELRTLIKETNENKRELPAGIVAFVSGILHDVSRGDMKVVTEMINRIHGKPVQKDIVSIERIDQSTIENLRGIFERNPSEKEHE